MCLTSQSHGGGAWALPSPPRQPSSAHGGSCGLSFPLPHSILPPSPHSSPSPLPPSPSFLPILPFPLLWMHLWVSVNRNWDREICLALFGNLLFPHLSFLCSAFIKHSAKHLTTNVRKSDKPPPPPLPPNMQVSLAWLSRQPWAGTMMVDKAGGLPIEEHTCCWPWLPAPFVLQWVCCERVASAMGLPGLRLNSTKSYRSGTIKQSKTNKKIRPSLSQSYGTKEIK